MKFEFLFKSVYSLFEKENAVKLTTFPSGSDLYIIVSSNFPVICQSSHCVLNDGIILSVSISSIWLPVLETVGPFMELSWTFH